MSDDNQSEELNVTSLAEPEQTGVEEPGSNPKDGTEKKPEPLHLKTKPIPAVITLTGGIVITVDVFIQQVEFKRSLVYILVGLVVFFIAGELIKMLLDRIEIPNPDTVGDDGNVIQKGKSGEGEDSAGSGEGTGDTSVTMDGMGG
ncbi:MAG: hypothetical protein K6G42_07900 [Lachnospiraceae bacterium]|nr:hypothetical protein [Lachnospiraceae bacterium]